MRAWLIAFVVTVAALLGPAGAYASGLCKLAVLQTVGAIEDSDSKLQAGTTQADVTQYNVDLKTKVGTFCFHGGYCYPRFVSIGGQQVEALRLTNCRIEAGGDQRLSNAMGFDSFDLKPERDLIGTKDLKIDRAENDLLRLGLCSACADNVARAYVDHPKSNCGSLAAQALKGDRAAIAAIRADDFVCKADDGDVLAVMTTRESQPQDAPPPATKADQTMHNWAWLLTLAVDAAVLYFAPSATALLRRKRNARPILALNLLLGWTFLGWVGALVWSLMAEPEVPAPT